MADGPDFRVLSFGNGCDSVRPYLKRKPYARSRTGCLACKQRRVKVCLIVVVVFSLSSRPPL